MTDGIGDAGRERRAQRFPIVLPIRYRAADEPVWHRGESANISHSGIFFRAERPLPERAVIEMRFVMPLAEAGEPPVGLACRGRIVRADASRSADGRIGIAATIEEYQFVRDPEHGGGSDAN